VTFARKVKKIVAAIADAARFRLELESIFSFHGFAFRAFKKCGAGWCDSLPFVITVNAKRQAESGLFVWLWLFEFEYFSRHYFLTHAVVTGNWLTLISMAALAALSHVARELNSVML
jgi:hypothetical protein